MSEAVCRCKPLWDVGPPAANPVYRINREKTCGLDQLQRALAVDDERFGWKRLCRARASGADVYGGQVLAH